MIVFRWEYEVKLGRSNAALEFVKGAGEQLGPLAADRAYYNRFGDGHRIAFEKTFESLADYEKWWVEYNATVGKVIGESGWKTFLDSFEKWNHREIWEVIE